MPEPALPPTASESGIQAYWIPGRGARLASEWKWPILSMIALYLPVIRMLQNVMATRPPLRLKWFVILWNMSLAACSLVGACIMLYDDWTIITRVSQDESTFLPRTRMVVALFCLTKVAEFGDTIILSLKKRKVIFLHVFHHLTVAVYCWHAQYIKVNFAHSFVFMNLVVHGAMYLYYAMATLLPQNKVMASIRPYITLSQIAQMLAGLWWNAQMSLIMYISYCFLFTAFFIENFYKSLRPAMVCFLGMFHIFAVVGIVRMCTHQQGLRLFTEMMCLYIVGGFGITCGAHRLWAHRSYKANVVFRTLLMICNSIANQGNIYRWSRDHRTHHKFSDTGKDPHNATRGFFYSHCGWLLLKKPVEVKEAGQEIDCSDLLADPVVRFQQILDPYWNQSISFLLPAVYGYFAYGDYWLGFFVLGAFRWLVCLHSTWTVNSVAHLWGARPYNKSIWPRENWVTVLVAVGEGWHNWHHEYPFDYATSEGGIFSQWNPSKAVIDCAAMLGWVWDRKRATELWAKAKARKSLPAAAGEDQADGTSDTTDAPASEGEEKSHLRKAAVGQGSFEHSAAVGLVGGERGHRGAGRE